LSKDFKKLFVNFYCLVLCAALWRNKDVYMISVSLHDSGVILQNSFTKCAFCHASLAVRNNLPHSVISDLTANIVLLNLGYELVGSRAFLQ